jgi:hypothetical protein
LAKIYSQLLLNRLTIWANEHDKILKNQFGFQKGKSIIDCIFILHSIIAKVINSGKKLYCIFIDYQQCFDKIERSFLWQKLISENVSLKLVNAIKSMYKTVKSCVSYKNSYSEYFSSNIGLKQGDPSSSLLFMLFVNDITQYVNSDHDGSQVSLQLMLNDVVNYYNIWGLKINTTKTKAMIFERGRHTKFDFYIDNTLIEIVPSFKYLGITLF